MKKYVNVFIQGDSLKSFQTLNAYSVIHKLT